MAGCGAAAPRPVTARVVPAMALLPHIRPPCSPAGLAALVTFVISTTVVARVTSTAPPWPDPSAALPMTATSRSTRRPEALWIPPPNPIAVPRDVAPHHNPLEGQLAVRRVIDTPALLVQRRSAVLDGEIDEPQVGAGVLHVKHAIVGQRGDRREVRPRAPDGQVALASSDGPNLLTRTGPPGGTISSAVASAFAA